MPLSRLLLRFRSLVGQISAFGSMEIIFLFTKPRKLHFFEVIKPNTFVYITNYYWNYERLPAESIIYNSI